jgi:hypothetical protein
MRRSTDRRYICNLGQACHGMRGLSPLLFIGAIHSTSTRYSGVPPFVDVSRSSNMALVHHKVETSFTGFAQAASSAFRRYASRWRRSLLPIYLHLVALLTCFCRTKRFEFSIQSNRLQAFWLFLNNVCSFWLLNHSTASLAHVVLSASLACHEMLHSCSLGPTI